MTRLDGEEAFFGRPRLGMDGEFGTDTLLYEAGLLSQGQEQEIRGDSWRFVAIRVDPSQRSRRSLSPSELITEECITSRVGSSLLILLFESGRSIIETFERVHGKVKR